MLFTKEQQDYLENLEIMCSLDDTGEDQIRVACLGKTDYVTYRRVLEEVFPASRKPPARHKST